MKDLLLSSDFYPMIGGAHHWLYNLYSRWPTQVITFADSKQNNDAEAAAQQRIFDSENHGSLLIRRIDLSFPDINIINSVFWKTLINAVRLISTETGNHPATLHCLRAFPDGILGLAWKAVAPRKRHIVTFAHGEEIFIARSSRQLQTLSSWVYKTSALVIANSLNTEALVRSLTPSARIAVIHPGVDSTAFKFTEEERAQHRTLYGFTPDDVVLVTVGRLEVRKNHTNVLKAIHRLRDSGLSLKYLIVGAGEEEQRLRNLVKDLYLDQAVKFTGILTDHERSLAMAIADIHIMPSIKHAQMIEGFGIVFIEAAATGIPSIAGNTGGQTEAVMDGKTGLVIDGTNMDAIISAIRQLAENQQLRRRLGESGRQWAAVHEWQTVVAETIQTVSHTIKNRANLK